MESTSEQICDMRCSDSYCPSYARMVCCSYFSSLSCLRKWCIEMKDAAYKDKTMCLIMRSLMLLRKKTFLKYLLCLVIFFIQSCLTKDVLLKFSTIFNFIKHLKS